MAEALRLWVDGSAHAYALTCGLPCLVQLDSWQVVGTTISPDLFFRQAAPEMEDSSDAAPRAPHEVLGHLGRINAGTIVAATLGGRDPLLHADRSGQ